MEPYVPVELYHSLSDNPRSIARKRWSISCQITHSHPKNPITAMWGKCCTNRNDLWCHFVLCRRCLFDRNGGEWHSMLCVHCSRFDEWVRVYLFVDSRCGKQVPDAVGWYSMHFKEGPRQVYAYNLKDWIFMVSWFVSIRISNLAEMRYVLQQIATYVHKIICRF